MSRPTGSDTNGCREDENPAKTPAAASPRPWFVVGVPWNDGPPWINAESADPHAGGYVCDLAADPDDVQRIGDASARAARVRVSAPSARHRFWRNVLESRDNGCDLLCAECGCGMTDEEFDDPEMHDTGCPNRTRDRASELAAFLKQRLGGD